MKRSLTLSCVQIIQHLLSSNWPHYSPSSGLLSCLQCCAISCQINLSAISPRAIAHQEIIVCSLEYWKSRLCASSHLPNNLSQESCPQSTPRYIAFLNAFKMAVEDSGPIYTRSPPAVAMQHFFNGIAFCIVCLQTKAFVLSLEMS